jgi:hypothetical protein
VNGKQEIEKRKEGKDNSLVLLNKLTSLVFSFSYTQQERASGMIKFLAGSCLSGLGIVLKEPSAI